MAASVRPERVGIMLAHPATDRLVKQLGDKYFEQRKLNGERCWVEWFNGKTPVLVSSYANEFHLPHITDALLQQNFNNIPLDGELYVHGESFENIHSMCSASRKDLHPDYQKIEFHVFDVKARIEQYKRLMYLSDRSLRPPLYFVETSVVVEGHWQDRVMKYIEEGYEGIILRSYNGLYVEQRTPNLLKFKPREKDHYRIVAVNEGEGWCTGSLGSFTVVGDDGTYFDVGTGKLLTKIRRKKLWEIRNSLPGKLLEVRHELIKTRNGIPKCVVAISVEGIDI